MIKLSTDVVRDIVDTLSSLPPEKGGILGADSNGTIVKYYLDLGAHTTCSTYTPSARIPGVVSEWNHSGFRLAGFIHSHPAHVSKLSSCDIAFAVQLASLNRLTDVLMAIYCCDGVFFYNVSAEGLCTQLSYETV